MTNEDAVPSELLPDTIADEPTIARLTHPFKFGYFLLWNVLWLFIVALAPLTLLPLLPDQTCNANGWICFTLSEGLLLVTMFVYMPVAFLTFVIAAVIMGFPQLSPQARQSWTAKQLSWKVCFIPVLLYYITVALTYLAILGS